MKSKEADKSYEEKWIMGREENRKLKHVSMMKMLKKVKGKDCYTKLESLIQLYMDSHDTVTKIGLEIAIIADENV